MVTFRGSASVKENFLLSFSGTFATSPSEAGLILTERIASGQLTVMTTGPLMSKQVKEARSKYSPE